MQKETLQSMHDLFIKLSQHWGQKPQQGEVTQWYKGYCEGKQDAYDAAAHTLRQYAEIYGMKLIIHEKTLVS